jgi:hypothetical protein
MCALVIIAILLTMYLFRHYTVIEGFDFSMPSTSSISMPSTSSISMPSMPSLSSSSQFGSIGPLPVDNKWSDQTITDFKVAYKTATEKDISEDELTRMYRFATENDAKYYISNGKWEWPSYYTNCINDSIRKSLADDAAKNGKPPPTEEQIKAYMDSSAERMKNMQQSPIREALVNPMSLKMLFDSCIASLKEAIFIVKMMWPFNTMGGGAAGQITTKDNNTIKCAPKYIEGSGTKVLLMTTSKDPTTNEYKSVETNFDQLPTLVPGFKYLKDGKITDGTTPCDCNNFSMCPFSLDDSGVSPFYSAFWGVPAGSSSSSSSTDSTSAPVSSSSSDDPTAVLKDMKAKLNSMSLN